MPTANFPTVPTQTNGRQALFFLSGTRVLQRGNGRKEGSIHVPGFLLAPFLGLENQEGAMVTVVSFSPQIRNVTLSPNVTHWEWSLG